MPFYFKSLLLSITLFSANACESQPTKVAEPANESEVQVTPIAQNIDVNTFSRYLLEKEDRQLLDVRTPGETELGIIVGAQEIDFNSPDFAKRVSELDKNKPVLVYCRSGARSGNAMRQMQNMGFKEIYNLEGGIMAWTGSGQSLVRK